MKYIFDIPDNVDYGVLTCRTSNGYYEYNFDGADLEQLPPAQLGTNLAEVGTDTISRQAAIDALRKLYITEPKINNDYSYDMALDQAEDAIKQLPPAQPEQLEQCPIYGGMCAYPSDQCYDCPRHAGAKMEVTT